MREQCDSNVFEMVANKRNTKNVGKCRKEIPKEISVLTFMLLLI